MAVDTDVLVVGAGPTGLLLAGELHRRGVACRLIDAHREPMHWDRATVVHPRSLEVFDSLGIVAPFLERGAKQKIARLHSAGEVLGEIDLAECGSRYGFNIGISEEVTESILTEYLQRQGGDVLRGSRLVGLREHPDGIVARVEHDAGTTDEISVQWLVGCDGYHSATREFCGIELVGHDIPDPWAVFDVTLEGWPPAPYEGNFAYFDVPPVILTALPDHRWRVYLRPSAPDSDLVADAASTLARYRPALRFENVENSNRFQCHTKLATRYRAGRVLLAGDAAHVCSPAQGHGMNSGLLDAHNLAWKLARVCKGQSAHGLLDSYEIERRPAAEIVTTSGDAFEQAQSVRDPAERRARDAALRATFANPTSRHHESVAEAELDIHYAGSPIVMGDAHPALAPGARLPDTIEVRLASGEVCGLHELAHRAGHTALLVGGSRASSDELARVERSVRERIDPLLVEATIALTARDVADRLGVDAISLLIIRPDGHVGLRADREHVDALAAYQSLLSIGMA